MIDLVAKSTLGNINRVGQFADLKNRKFPDMAFTPKLVRQVYAEMRVGGDPKK